MDKLLLVEDDSTLIRMLASFLYEENWIARKDHTDGFRLYACHKPGVGDRADAAVPKRHEDADRRAHAGRGEYGRGHAGWRRTGKADGRR